MKQDKQILINLINKTNCSCNIDTIKFSCLNCLIVPECDLYHKELKWKLKKFSNDYYRQVAINKFKEFYQEEELFELLL